MAEATYSYVYYTYVPSLPAAIIFAVLFLACSCIHTWQIWRYKALYFIPFVIGCICECLGYCGRAWSWSNNQLLSPFVMQSVLILVAPAFLAASIYMAFSRIVRDIKMESQCIIRTTWITKIFVTFDVLSFFIQGGGAGYEASGSLEAMDNGKYIIVAGLVIQIVAFAFYIFVTLLFRRRMRKFKAQLSFKPVSDWSRYMDSILAACFLILARNIVRLVEYLQGLHGFIITHEYMLYIFDSLFVFTAVVILIVRHPGNFTLVMDHNETARGDIEASNMIQK